MKKTFEINLPTLTSNSQGAVTLANTKKLGELKQERVIYSPYEALYLVETKKAEPIKNTKKLTNQQTISLLSKKQKNFYQKYLVFKYLRKKGYIVKTGLKFGGEFRVYEKKPSKKFRVTEGTESLAHATYITYIIDKKINLEEFISKNRIAHSTAKKLLLAVVDSEESITFYETNWIKP